MYLRSGRGWLSVTGTWAIWRTRASASNLVRSFADDSTCLNGEQTSSFDSAVICSDAADLNVKLQLAEVYDELGHRAKALELVNEGQ